MDEAEKSRLEAVYKAYEAGSTLVEIGKIHGVTRERIRQLIRDAMLYKISALADSGTVVDIGLFVKDFKERHRANRIQREMGNFDDVRPGLLERAVGYHSLLRFAKDTNISQGVLQKHFPDVIKIIQKNAEKFKQRWSRYYLRCRQCGTTSVKHQSAGLCRDCYLKSDYFKEINKASFERHREKRVRQQREYLREYAKRPEVIAKHRRQWDLKNYGGNAEKALQRDGYQCVACGMNRETSLREYGRDLYMRHVDNDASNNNLDNLKTLCRRCFGRERKAFNQAGTRS